MKTIGMLGGMSWETCYDEDGNAYEWNRESGETRWSVAQNESEWSNGHF